MNPEITPLYQFHAQKALFKVPKICDINFWIENDHPPPSSARFQKIIRYGCRTLPLHSGIFANINELRKLNAEKAEGTNNGKVGPCPIDCYIN